MPHVYAISNLLDFFYICRMILRVIRLVIVLLFSHLGYGQNYIYNRLTIGDGLLSNHVLCVWQDSTGYLWIGTQNGLQRFDGISMRTVLNERVDQVLSDGAGTVWIRSGSRVGQLDIRKFKVNYVDYEGSGEVYGPFKVWLRSDRGKVFLVNTGKSCQYFDAVKGVFSIQSAPFSLPDTLQVTDIVPDPYLGRYWVLSRNDFGFWDQANKSYYSKSKPGVSDPMFSNGQLPASIRRLYIDKKKRYWMISIGPAGSRFYCFDGQKAKFAADIQGTISPSDDQGFEVYGFGTYADSITIAYGLNYFRGHHGSSFIDLRSPANNPYGIHFNSIAGIFEDREGVLWLATDNGLYHTTVNRSSNIHIQFSQDQPRTAISSLLTDRHNRVWIGTWGSGTNFLDIKSRNANLEPVEAWNSAGDSMRRIWSLCEDNRGVVWGGSDQGRLASYDVINKRASVYAPKAFLNQGIRQMISVPGGRLWAGLQNGSVWSFDPLEPSSDRSFKKLFELRGPVSRMVILPGNRLWIAVTGKGLFIIDIQKAVVLETLDIARVGSSDIAGLRDILPVNDSLVLLAGEHLGAVDPRTYTVNFGYLRPGQLPGTQFALQKDVHNNVWVGGASGIYRLDPQTKVLTRYGQQDGLITIHNSSYVPERSSVLKNGWMAFGGNQHLVIFDPQTYEESLIPPNVTITGFQLNNTFLDLDSLLTPGKIILPYSQNSFRIDFAAISFSHQDRITYEYKMEGLDQAWVQLSAGGHVNYHLLPHGHYRFKVRAKNEQGRYASATTDLELYIEPPFWNTIWFYLLVVLLSGGILFYLHRLRLQKLLHIEKVRNRLARDLHDEMGSTLSTINILSNIALQQKTLDEEKNKQYLNTISQSTHQMMEAMDDIVWSINPVNDSIGKIVARMKETAGSVLEPQHIEYNIDSDPSVLDLPLSMESRREIFLIFKEALNNIVKYAQCSQVTVGLKRKGAELILTIADDGVGFEQPLSGSTVRGNGLRNMQMRAGNLKASLTVDSEPGKGTTIKFSLPIA
jgi:signal transduction histidine kinase/streptogramin lyase